MPLTRYNPDQYLNLLQDKETWLIDKLSTFTRCSPDIFASPNSHFRYRAEFRFWHHADTADYVLFPKGDNTQPIHIEDYPIGSRLMNQKMQALKVCILGEPELKDKLFQVEFLTSLSGQCLVTLIYHKPLDESWQKLARSLSDQLNISVIGRSKKQKIILDNDAIEETLQVNGKPFYYQQVESSFTQPNPHINQAMLSWACHQLSNSDGDLLELYCGNGNFTMPLAQHFNKVLATEVSKSSIQSARYNCTLNQINNVKFIRLSSEEFTEAFRGTREFRRLKQADVNLEDYQFSTALVDPPRAGLDKQTLALISKFDQILYISCNPQTLTDNLKTLAHDFTIKKWALFDQFPYTDHTEVGVFLTRKNT